VKSRALALSIHASVFIALTIVVCVAEKENLKNYIPILYSLQLLLILGICYKLRGGNSALVRPSIVGVTYLNISFILGAVAFNLGQITQNEMLDAYRGWHDSKEILLFFVVANFVATVPAISESQQQFRILTIIKSHKLSNNIVTFIILTLILLLTTILEHELIAVIRITISIAIFVIAFQARSKLRWIIVVSTIFLIATVSSDSKRNAIFLALPAIWLELRYGATNRINIKTTVLATLGTGFLVVLVMAMSIMRGYGLLNPDNFLDAIALVPEYVQDPQVWAFLANNFEFSTVFFSSHNSIHLINQDFTLLSMGETLIKPIFTGIPEEIFDYKPRTILDLYTNAWSPSFRGIGGSYPITFFSEFYWNFYWFGIFPLFGFMFLIEKFYNNLLLASNVSKSFPLIFWMCIYFYTLFLMRGSGVDIVVAYTIISLLTIITIIIPARAINQLIMFILRNVRQFN
jgi:hypothetical protein